MEKQIAGMLAEAAAVDAAEDRREGDPGGQPPADLVDPATRRGRLTAARERLQEAKTRLTEAAAARAQLFAQRCAATNAARAVKGLPPKQPRPRPNEAPQPQATTNLTDPDSRVLRGRHGKVQGYNAQLAVTAEQIIVAAQVCQAADDVEQLAPMLAATRATLAAAGITAPGPGAGR